MKARKKPVEVEVRKLTEDNLKEVMAFISEGGFATVYRHDPKQLDIETLEGWITASLGDYIIKGVQGEFYPCKPDIFDKTYEIVEEDKPIIDELMGIPLPEGLKEHINENLMRYL